VPGTTLIVYVSDEDHARAMWTFERETGECHNCKDGQESAGWDRDVGRLTRTCHRCKGTGKAPASVVAEVRR
jgi:hypothetical protein